MDGPTTPNPMLSLTRLGYRRRGDGPAVLKSSVHGNLRVTHSYSLYLFEHQRN